MYLSASREIHSAQDDRLNLASRNFLIGPSLTPPQTAFVLPISQPGLPTEDSSTQSKQSSSIFSSPSVVSHGQWPSEHRQSPRNTPSGRNDTYWRILRFHRACAPKLAGRCCSSYRCKACRTGCKRCRRNTCVRSSHRQPHKLVILSAVNASRSEAFTESKDPMPAYSGNGDARHSHHSSVRAAGRMPCSACAASGSVGVLRLHLSRASRETNSAQDDRFYLISTVSILVVSFPRMSMTFTTTVYLPGSTYSCFTESSSFGFFRVR